MTAVLLMDTAGFSYAFYTVLAYTAAVILAAITVGWFLHMVDLAQEDDED